jgi:hypothetical protein
MILPDEELEVRPPFPPRQDSKSRESQDRAYVLLFHFVPLGITDFKFFNEVIIGVGEDMNEL